MCSRRGRTAHSFAWQHGGQIDVDLVEQPGVQAPLDVCAPCAATDLGPAADLLEQRRKSAIRRQTARPHAPAFGNVTRVRGS